MDALGKNSATFDIFNFWIIWLTMQCGTITSDSGLYLQYLKFMVGSCLIIGPPIWLAGFWNSICSWEGPVGGIFGTRGGAQGMGRRTLPHTLPSIKNAQFAHFAHHKMSNVLWKMSSCALLVLKAGLGAIRCMLWVETLWHFQEAHCTLHNTYPGSLHNDYPGSLHI